MVLYTNHQPVTDLSVPQLCQVYDDFSLRGSLEQTRAGSPPQWVRVVDVACTPGAAVQPQPTTCQQHTVKDRIDHTVYRYACVFIYIYIHIYIYYDMYIYIYAVYIYIYTVYIYIYTHIHSIYIYRLYAVNQQSHLPKTRRKRRSRRRTATAAEATNTTS